MLDWSNLIIQHNPTPSIGRGGFKSHNGKGNAHWNPLRDKKHGRIYKIASDFGYKGVNYLVQGTSADIMSERMIAVDEYLI